MPKSQQPTHSLIGRWKKSVSNHCKTRYPSEVEFQKHGLYRADAAANEGAIWHGGDWQYHHQQLSIQSANDAMLHYRIHTLSADSLTLVDDTGCQIHYRKIN